MRDVEIDQQPYALTADSEVREQLLFMHWQDRVDGLDFDDDDVFDQEIDFVPDLNCESVILDG